MAEIEGGELKFSAVMDDSSMTASIQRTIDNVKKMSASVVSSGKMTEDAYMKMKKDIAGAFGNLDQIAEKNASEIKDLKSEYERLGASATEAFKKGTKEGDEEYRSLKAQQAEISKQIATRQNLSNEIAETADNLAAEERNLDGMTDSLQKNEQAHGSLRSQIKLLTQQLVEMEANGERGTEQYRQVQAEVARLTDAFGDATAQARILAHDNAGLQGVISAVGGVAGAFSVAQGAAALFGKENENLQKAMLKVQSIMAITNGLQQVANTLNKDSAFSLTILTKAKLAFGKATEVMATGLRKFNISAKAANITAKALTATLTMGLSVAITAAITMFEKFRTRQAEAAEKQKELNDSITEAAVKPVAAVNELSLKYRALGDDMKAKEKFIKDNKKAFEELGVQVNNVAEAENLLIANKDKFVEAQLAKAKAVAIAEKAQEKVKELIEKELEMENTPQQIEEQVWTQAGQFGGYYSGTGKMIDNPAYKRVKAEKEAIEQEVKDLYGSVSKFEKEASNTMKDANIVNVADAASGAVSDYSSKLNEMKQKYAEFEAMSKSTDATTRAYAKSQYQDMLEQGKTYLEYLKNQRKQTMEAIRTGGETDELKERLKTLNVEISASMKSTDDAEVARFANAMNAELEKAESLQAKLDILSRYSEELKSKPVGTDVFNAETKAITDAANAVNKELKNLAEQSIRDYIDAGTKRMTKAVEFENKMAALRKAYNDSTDEGTKEVIKKAMEMERKLYDVGIDGMDEFQSLLNEGLSDVAAYEQKKFQIVKKWEKKIEAARMNGDERTALLLEGKRDLEIYLADEKFVKMMKNLNKMSKSAMDEAFNNFKKMLEQMVKENKMTVDEMNNQLDEYGEKLNQNKSELSNEENAWSNLFGGDNKGKLGKALLTGDGSMGSLGEMFGEMGGMAGEAMDAMSGTMDMVIQIIMSVVKAIRSISEMLDHASRLAASFGDEKNAKNLEYSSKVINAFNDNVGAAVESFKNGDLIGVITNTVNLFMDTISAINEVHDDKLQMKIEKHENDVEALGRAYNNLRWEIDRIVGTKVFEAEAQSIENLREQKKEIEEMIKLEEQKKAVDKEYVKEMQQQIVDNEHAITETYERIKETILQTSVKDFAGELATAISESFVGGIEMSRQAVDDAVTQLMQNMVSAAIQRRYIEEPLNEALDEMYTNIMARKSMANSLKYLGVGDDDTWAKIDTGLPTQGDIDTFREKVQGIADSASSIFESYKDLFGAADGTDEELSGLQGAIKGASQESIDLLVGQTNAVRVNQVVQIDLIREQLVQLTMMSSNTASIRDLTRNIVTILEGRTGEDGTLRAQGL